MGFNKSVVKLYLRSLYHLGCPCWNLLLALWLCGVTYSTVIHLEVDSLLLRFRLALKRSLPSRFFETIGIRK